MTRLVKKQGGFSLIEMAMVLLVAGLIGAAIWKLLPLLKPVDSRVTAQGQLDAAEQALSGFMLARHRLPCAATVAGGVENCTVTTGRWLPQATLGLSGQPLRYGVYRNAPDPAVAASTAAAAATAAGLDAAAVAAASSAASAAASLAEADLAVAKDRYQPRLPPGAAGLIAVNGLDLCKALHSAILRPNPAALRAGSGGATLAFALAHPGERDADGDGNAFDGLNAVAGFPEEGQRNSGYDDYTRLVGAAELSGRLGCPAAIGRVDGAARSAYVAYDNLRYIQLYEQFRILGYEVRKQNLEMAQVTQTLAIADLIIAIGTVTSGSYLSAASGGSGYAALAKGILALGAASGALAAAVIGRENAEKALGKADRQLRCMYSHVDPPEDKPLEGCKGEGGRLLPIAQDAELLAVSAAINVHNQGLLP